MNGQSGEFAHLINRRKITLANASMAAFETGLRSYENKRAKSIGQIEENYNGQAMKDRPIFQALPKIDRGDYPYYLVTQKELEKYKKTNPVYSNDRLLHPLKPPSTMVKVLAL